MDNVHLLSCALILGSCSKHEFDVSVETHVSRLKSLYLLLEKYHVQSQYESHGNYFQCMSSFGDRCSEF